MARIRVGVRAWEGAEGAFFPDEMATSRNIVWVEIDGCRIDGHFVKVWGNWGEGAHTTKLEIIGVPEFVPLAPDLEPVDAPIDDQRAAALVAFVEDRSRYSSTEDKVLAARRALEIAEAEHEKTIARHKTELVNFRRRVEEHRGR